MADFGPLSAPCPAPQKPSSPPARSAAVASGKPRNADVPEEKQIVYRIGINIGDIVVEDDDIYGDGVNVAARIEGLAEPSGICVARNVFDQVKDKLDLNI